jgi:hypothetical protein
MVNETGCGEWLALNEESVSNCQRDPASVTRPNSPDLKNDVIISHTFLDINKEL